MPRVRRFESAQTQTDLRETNRKTGEHGFGELGWETALLHELAPLEVGQTRRRQRPVPPRIYLGRQRTEAEVRSRFHRAQTGPAASHALWIDKNRRTAHHHRGQVMWKKA